MFFKNKVFKEYLPVLIIAILVAVFFGKSLFPGPNQIIYGGDLNDQFYYWKGFLAENIRQGIIPYWNPYSFSGTPFLAHPSVAAFYPLTILFILLPLNMAFSIYLYIHLVLAGSFMYILCRKFTDKISSLAGGIIFSLSGLMAARIYSGHIDIISTLIWIPAVFWSISNAVETRKRRDIYLAIIFLTLQILAGYQAVVIFTLELIFIYELVITFLMSSPRSSCKGKQGSRQITWIPDPNFAYRLRWARQVGNDNIIRNLLIFLFIVLISYGISAVQTLPTIEFVRNSIRGQGLPYDLLTWGSYTIDQFQMFINPFRYGNPFPESYTYKGPGPNFFEISYFVGVIPLFIVSVYILHNLYILFTKKIFDKKLLGLFFGTLFFSLISMGNNFPLHKLVYQIFPVYRLFRFPSQHLILVVFILSFIAGLSLNIFKNKIIKLVILLLIIIELLSFDKQFIRLQNISLDTIEHKLTPIQENNNELTRLLPDYSVISPVRRVWDFESSMQYRIHSTSGYNPILLSNYYQYIDRLNNNHSSSISQYNVEIPPPDPSAKEIDFLNVKYVLADKNFDLVGNKSLAKYSLKTEGETYKLYENKDYLPRIFVSCPNGIDQKVNVIEYKLNSIKMSTNFECDGILSSSEVYYPEWKAKIDGNEVKINLIKNTFRSVNITKGIHKIEFYYQPTIYYVGGLISLGSLMNLIWILKKVN